VAAVGGADIVRVFVETSDGQLTQSLRQTLAERTGIHHSGFAVAAVHALPRLPSGKIDYAALEAS
jgi:acyl-coenzyme A synthetase/AMP-(fatty) acid ligase